MVGSSVRAERSTGLSDISCRFLPHDVNLRPANTRPLRQFRSRRCACSVGYSLWAVTVSVERTAGIGPQLARAMLRASTFDSPKTPHRAQRAHMDKMAALRKVAL